MSLLDRVNRAIGGLCPCGAEPAEGSAYCSDDCRPTHISRDTDTRMSGDLATAMRWRPDLVTEAPDDDLVLEMDNIPRGPYTGQRYWNNRTNRYHLRLNDGHRFVGTDLLGEVRFEEAWQRLERELSNTRHLAADDDPWGDVMGRLGDVRPRVCEWLRANNLDPVRIPIDAQIVTTAGEIEIEEYAADWSERITRQVPLLHPWPDDLYCPNHVGMFDATLTVIPSISAMFRAQIT